MNTRSHTTVAAVTLTLFFGTLALAESPKGVHSARRPDARTPVQGALRISRHGLQ